MTEPRTSLSVKEQKYQERLRNGSLQVETQLMMGLCLYAEVLIILPCIRKNYMSMQTNSIGLVAICHLPSSKENVWWLSADVDICSHY